MYCTINKGGKKSLFHWHRPTTGGSRVSLMESDMTFRGGKAGCNPDLWGRGLSVVRSKTKTKKII